jgi:hypothetical protein
MRDCAVHSYCFRPGYKYMISNETTCQLAVTHCRIAMGFKALHATLLFNKISSYWYILRAGLIFFCLLLANSSYSEAAAYIAGSFHLSVPQVSLVDL